MIKEIATQIKLEFDSTFQNITLQIYLNLHAVDLLVALLSRLVDAGISVKKLSSLLP